MNLNFYSTKDYDNKTRFPAPGKQTQFKPNSNPIINNQSSILVLSRAEGITYPPSPKAPTSPNYPQPKLKPSTVAGFPLAALLWNEFWDTYKYVRRSA